MDDNAAAQTVDCFVLSLTHTLREHRYITLWRPENCGYTWALSDAGRYPQDHVLGQLGYYNSGESIAVPCSVLEHLAVAPVRGNHDNDAGPCVENNRENWKLLLAHAIAPPRFRPQPQH
jgi:hypothetical protein